MSSISLELPETIEELRDVSNSEAYKIIDTLLDDLVVSPERGDTAKSRYAKLHAALFAAMSREKELLSQAKQLKRKLEEDERTAKIGLASGGGVEATIDTLREDVESAMAEAALAQERQQLLQLEVTDLQRQRNDLSKRGQEVAVEHAAALAPLIDTLRSDITVLRVDNETERERVAQTQEHLQAAKAKVVTTNSEIDALALVKSQERLALTKVEQLPDKAKRQVETVSGVLKNLQSQMEAANAKLQELEAAFRAVRAKEQELQNEHAKLLNGLDRARVQVQTKDRHADDIRKDLELASIEADKILADQVDLDMRIKAAAAQAKMESEVLTRKVREKELGLRQIKAAEAALIEAQDALPNLRFQVEQLQRDRATLEAHAKMQHSALEEVRRDLDISMNDFLKEEAVGKDKASVFQVTLKQVGFMEEELLALRKEEAERTKILMELGSQRDRVALAIAQKLAKVKEVQLTTRIKEVELAELKKIRRETNRRIRDFEKLYDLVKNQRNKFVNLIQAANQATTEMKDKSKILHNEQDILHNEVNVKDRLLNQSRNQHGIAVTERDALRIELGKYGATFRDKQDRVDEQIADVDKLNAIINLTEKDMLKLRKQYETVIEARNYTGIMLIDRNDELCILYEKANIQEEVLKSGDLELRHKDDEIRILRLEVASLERSIAVAIKVVPQIPALDEDVARLQKALLEARRESEALSLALENPSNQARWRLLEGKIPDKEELSAKLQQLEERLNDRKEALLEKELILEEVTQLSDKLREQASEGRADTLELAQKVNEYQGRLRAVTRRIMATVSELSMYQATSLKLGAEKEGLEGAEKEARQRLEQGLPPTEDAEREWQRRLREASTLQELASTRAEEAHILEAKGTEVDSAAEPRPNAYIPEDLGIPKPYGAFAPFKPSDAGSTMRHIRKPNPPEIII
ncbi:coiled-coil flagellar protein, move backward only 2 [Haematococcus lacustris]